MGDVSRNFSLEDFQCRCQVCATDPDRPGLKAEALNALQNVRDFLGEPIIINRGVSCSAHNQALGGAGDSRHLPEHADAVDCRSFGSDYAYRLVRAAMTLGKFSFIELAPDHLHLDMRPGDKRLITGKDHA